MRNYKCSERWGQSLRTFSLVKGLPVIEINSGSKLGEVCDLSISSDGKVEGVLLKKKTLFHKMRLISIRNIDSFGSDGIMVSHSQVLEPLNSPPEHTIDHQRKLTWKNGHVNGRGKAGDC